MVMSSRKMIDKLKKPLNWKIKAKHKKSKKRSYNIKMFTGYL